MTSLPETALAFARECMGLTHVPAYDITDGVAFPFTDLNAVMAAVTKWCKSGIEYCPVCHKTEIKNNRSKRFRVRPSMGNKTIYHSDDDPEYYADIVLMIEGDSERQSILGSAKSDDLRQALMSACLEAARKIKGQAA